MLKQLARVFTLLLFASGFVYAQGPVPLFVDATSADNFKVLFITRAKVPPVIDGNINDACWKDAEVISDFGPCEYGARSFPFPRTEARFLWDDRYLYIAFTCYEDTPENMEHHNKSVTDKSKAIYDRDCMELHIDGNNDNATKFQIWFIDTLEKQIFWYYDFGWGILVNENYGLSADWEYASFRGTDYWQIEGRIALAHIQVEPRVGYIFGMNPCRFRFDMKGTRDDGQLSEHVTQFLSWSTQGGDHHDARAFGKCILVEKQPSSIADGLKLAFPDLDRRTVMVQTGNGFYTLDHGRQLEISYLDKLKEELTLTQISAKKLQDTLILTAPPSVNMKQYAEWTKPQLDKLATMTNKIGSYNQITVSEMNTIRKELEGIRNSLENYYWIVQRALLLAERIPRVTVNLKSAVVVPVDRDEPENTPDPRTRQIPYVPWAKNFVGGKTQALIITSEGASWGAYELLQRMDMESDIFYATGNLRTSIAPETDYYREGILLFPQKKAQLQKLLEKKHDAYIFLDFSPERLPGDLQYVITQRMIDGAAVIVFQSQDWNFSGFPDGKIEKDTLLLKSIPYRTMQKLITPVDWWIDHRGMGHDSLEREPAPMDVPPVSKRTVGKGVYVSFQPGGAGYWYTNPLTPHIQNDPDERFQDEYYLSFAVKAILDATGKLGQRRLYSVNCNTVPYVPGTKGTATVTTSGPAFTGRLRIVIRDQWGNSLSDIQNEIKMRDGKSEIPILLPALNAGNYYVDVWLLQNNKVVDWASQRFRVQGKVMIRSIQFVSRTVKETDRVKADVTVENAGPSATLRAEIRDVNGRVLQRIAGLKIQDGRTRVDLPLRGAWNTYHRLDMYVDDGGLVQDRATKSFYVDHAPHDDFTVFTDGEGVGHYGSLRRQILRSFGVNLFENSGNPEDILADGGDLGCRYWLTGSTNETGGSLASDVYHRYLFDTLQKFTQTYARRAAMFVSTGDDSGVQSDFVDNYPNWVMPLVRQFAQKYPPVSREGDRYPFVPSEFFRSRNLPSYGEYWRFLWNTALNEIKNMKLQPGDWELFISAFKETYPTIAAFNRANGTSFPSFEAITSEDLKKINPKFSPDVIGFQDWLRNKYGTIETLNNAWGSQQKSFETIDAPGIIPELTAEGKYAAAIDKRAYLEDLFIRHMETAGRAVHSIDPRIGVGQGAASFDNIIPEVLEYTDTFAPYLADVNIEIGRSMPHKWVGQTLGVYGGKAVKVPARRQQAWHVLFTGGNFIWFWSASTGGLMGDLTVNPNRSGAMLETIKEMKSGIASCLLRAERQHDGIAILHSRASGHMDGVVKEMSTQANSELAFQRLVEDLGMQYQYISSKQLEAGLLRQGKFKVLLLPYSQILSPKEVEEISQFVKGGGTVIADLRAATFSTGGQPFSRGPLDELFGVSRKDARARPVRGTLTISGLVDTSCTMDGFVADASIMAKTARFYGNVGDIPALLVNDVGKGKAILLNINLGAYDFLLNRNAIGSGRETFTKLFALAGVQSRFQVLSHNKPVPGVELAVFKRGGAQFLTAEKRSFEFERYPFNAEIVLDGKYYVTDLRTKKFLGLVERIPVKLEGLGCYVWSLLPYKVEGIEVRAPKSVKRGDDMRIEIALRTSAPSAPHVVRVEVTSPTGGIPHEPRLLDTNKGGIVCTLPIAFNEELGPWKIKVTDVSSGVSSICSYTVTEK